MVSLKNKIVLITGSSIGIGREAVFLFAKEGAIDEAQGEVEALFSNQEDPAFQ